jgi:hypothetical protein
VMKSRAGAPTTAPSATARRLAAEMTPSAYVERPSPMRAVKALTVERDQLHADLKRLLEQWCTPTRKRTLD